MKKILDLYSGAGLAAIGYRQAGFHVTGVDIEKKTCYAGDTWIQADALEILSDLNFCRRFDAIHASPPCQRYSQSTAMFRARGKVYADLIEPTREALELIGLPYIIENVPTAPVRPDIVLHGWMFGLKVMRKRHFELGGWWMMQPVVSARIGSVKEGDFITIIGKQGFRKTGVQNLTRVAGSKHGIMLWVSLSNTNSKMLKFLRGFLRPIRNTSVLI